MRSNLLEFRIPIPLFPTCLHLPGIKSRSSRSKFPTASKPFLDFSFHTAPLGMILGNSPFTLPLVARFPEVMFHNVLEPTTRELLEPFRRLSISSAEILIPVADPRDISEPHSSDSDLSLDKIFRSPESPAFCPAFPGGFDFDEPFDPPTECQELSPLSELTSSSSPPSSDSELAAEQLLLPSHSLIANSATSLSTQIPVQNSLASTLLNSAPILPRIPIQIPVPPRIMSGARDMPLRGSNKAPKFS
ncbi:hypothetical protein M404DRAFT_29329, partial [Pisolithus tinctorius Marx 270]